MEAGEFWSIGDYSIVGDLWSAPGRDLAGSLDLTGRDVIDLATGTGVTAIAMANLDARSVAGVDAAPKLLAEAARRADADGVDIDWIEADVTSVPLPDQSADIVVSTFGIIFADDPDAAIHECHRLARPGGQIIFTSWSGSGLFGQIRQALAPYFPDAPVPWHESPHRIRSIVGTGVDVVEQSFVMAISSPEAFVSQLEHYSPSFIIGAQTLGDQWPQARADLLDVVTAAGEVQRDSYRAQVDYLVTTIPVT